MRVSPRSKNSSKNTTCALLSHRSTTYCLPPISILPHISRHTRLRYVPTARRLTFVRVDMEDEMMVDGKPWWTFDSMAKLEEMRQSRHEPAVPLPHQTTAQPPPVPPSRQTAKQQPAVKRNVEPIVQPVVKPAVKTGPVGPLTLPSAGTAVTTPAAPPRRAARPPSKRKETSSEDDAAGETTVTVPVPNLDDPSPPGWYDKISPQQANRVRVATSIEAPLDQIESGIQNCLAAVTKGRAPDPAEFEEINDAIHKIAFLQLNPSIIRKARLLHNDTGLPKIFCQRCSGNVNWPWYMVEDAAELYTKLWSNDFDPNLFRGIVQGRSKNEKLGRTGTADHVDRKFEGRRRGFFHGNGHLRNGQWWPTQLCAVRDGAHSAIVGGICGNKGEGAWSCVMSGGEYPNVDNGDEVYYYGTESSDPTTPTDATLRMIESAKSGEPVRVLRAAKMTTQGTNRYKPAEGMRYDGLYKVEGYEVKDLTKQVHLFHLVRVPGQGAIRYRGPEVRPTREELEALEALDKAKKKKKKFLV